MIRLRFLASLCSKPLCDHVPEDAPFTAESQVPFSLCRAEAADCPARVRVTIFVLWIKEGLVKRIVVPSRGFSP
jgi:hypothetical protein